MRHVEQEFALGAVGRRFLTDGAFQLGVFLLERKLIFLFERLLLPQEALFRAAAHEQEQRQNARAGEERHDHVGRRVRVEQSARNVHIVVEIAPVAVHSVVTGQALPPGIDQRFRLAARADAAELLVCGGVRADEGRLVRRGHAVAVREDHDSRGLGVVAVEQILHGEHGFLRERGFGVPPGEHRAAPVRKAVHGGVSERAVGQLHAADVGALRMADHGEHALRLQIGLKPGVADAVRAVFADQMSLRVHDRNAGQPQPIGVLPQRVLAAVER